MAAARLGADALGDLRNSLEAAVALAEARAADQGHGAALQGEILLGELRPAREAVERRGRGAVSPSPPGAQMPGT